MEMSDVEVPAEFVQHIMGPGGATLRDIRAMTGNSVLISVLPAATPGGPQTIRLTGAAREMARGMVEKKLEEARSGIVSGQPPPPPGPPPPAAFPGAPQMPQVVLPPNSQ